MAEYVLAQGRTYLDTSHGLQGYAERNGALFDKQRREWYVLGEVPIDLLNLVPKETRIKDPPVVAPSCPICGFHTKIIEGKRGRFFGCSQYRVSKCRGMVDYDKYLDSIDQPLPKSVESILNSEAFEQSARAAHAAKTMTVTPHCPKCGSPTTLIKGKNGLFFGCSQYRITECRGSLDYDKYLASIDPSLANPVDGNLDPEPLKQPAKVVLPQKTSPMELKPELKSAIQEFERICKTEFKSRAELDRWLKAPKVALSGKTPLECMLTLAGCNTVIRLLQTRWD